ncbi:hypothetical protein OQI89_14050 [Lentilactobacillus diolivorans]|uniref:hypothetical protein n=1 Tax=Lentilactobacillus diolivorans TaxID=179838 RepID=UPI00246922BE|nr:hypothetical protein [Lentilactobacillus diolivorans]MDH5106957.1 hypothetical protein [Lentilactobacillus diolivorans]
MNKQQADALIDELHELNKTLKTIASSQERSELGKHFSVLISSKNEGANEIMNGEEIISELKKLSSNEKMEIKIRESNHL